MEILVLVLMAFTWAALAAYIGLAAFLAWELQPPHRGAWLVTAFLILVPTACFLDDPNCYRWLDSLILRDAARGRAFYAGQFALNAAFFVGLTLSSFDTRHLPATLRRTARRIILGAALPPLLWVLPEPRSIFLPLPGVPHAEFLASRLLFITFFLLISFGTYCLLAASKVEQK